MMKSLDITTFAARIGQVFRLTVDETTAIATRLIAVTPAPAGWGGPGAAGRVPFSLVFQAPPGTELPQRIYQLQHDELGMLDLFLVPIGRDTDGMCYEAVFS